MADHRKLTEMALTVLPEQDRAALRDQTEALMRDYCRWPDLWLNPDRHAEIDPYLLTIDGIPFHYPPMSRPDYLYWRMDATPAGPRPQPVLEADNANWRFFERGVRHYLREIACDLTEGRVADGARRLGILLHFFQDTHTLHALEGPWGTDCFVLDRLLDVADPDADHHVTALDLLSRKGRTEGEIAGHVPRLEGTTVDEAVFRLYQRYVEAAQANRRLHVPLVHAAMHDDEPTLDRLYRQMHERLARLSADLLHTACRLATEHFDAEAARALESVALDALEPIHRPWIVPGPYRFCAMVPGACLDGSGRKHPLLLRDGNGRIEQFDRGWGGGAHVAPLPIVHELPSGVYRHVRGRVGLHAELGRGGCVEVAIELGDRTLAHQVLDDQAPTLTLDAAVETGGPLRLKAWRDPAWDHDPAAANLCWADWRLLK